MSYFHSRPLAGRDSFSNADEWLPSFGGYSPSGQTPDRAIDSQLRSVPLPEGLMTRLRMLAYTMPDDADRVDYLGC